MKRRFFAYSGKIMMKQILALIMITYILFFIAPIVFASTMNFEVSANISINIQNLPFTTISDIMTSLYGYGTYPNESVVPMYSYNNPSSLTYPGGGPWLQYMNISTNYSITSGSLSGHIYGQLNMNGPNLNAGLGYGDVQQHLESYIFTLPLSVPVTGYYLMQVSVDWNYHYKLSQDGGNLFTYAAWAWSIMSDTLFAHREFIFNRQLSPPGDIDSPFQSGSKYNEFLVPLEAGEGNYYLRMIIEQSGHTYEASSPPPYGISPPSWNPPLVPSSAVPLPSTLLLLGTGLLGLVGWRKFRKG
jgi:hypothetical protein